jgi:hypothetical protein
MYVISLDHYLDAKGAIAIEKGPGRKIADFATAAVRLVRRQLRFVSLMGARITRPLGNWGGGTRAMRGRTYGAPESRPSLS